jgi:hypothetical protein
VATPADGRTKVNMILVVLFCNEITQLNYSLLIINARLRGIAANFVQHAHHRHH